ncbi:methyltransferase domain-containing protein [Algoriphagus sp. AGSA1]|uniref:class I SAM-dependent methyltransferase n=1 Tax=Algoriphagus sp. AGSA1 TaxID=2907213 RepID=UPI001F1F1491|nr:class I SAM-dependent methyltransferase [Algoriphagus sp. AGSA1]MCE7053157.1 methyltransferase domain-containing protein [Algoriphagus sp. AGSA1]
MERIDSWKYNEFKQVGKDYSSEEEVNVYESSHADFRDIKQESVELIEKLKLKANDVLADFGSGTGIFAMEAAKVCKKVFAVDISNKMLAYSKNKAIQNSITNIEFCNSGFLNFKIDDESLNFATSTFSFHHLPDYWKGIALERLNKMLAYGGCLYIKDVVIEKKNSTRNIQGFIDRQEFLGGDFLKEDAEVHFREEFSTYDWILDGLLERSGFKILGKELYDGVIAEYLCVKE